MVTGRALLPASAGGFARAYRYGISIDPHAINGLAHACAMACPRVHLRHTCGLAYGCSAGTPQAYTRAHFTRDNACTRSAVRFRTRLRVSVFFNLSPTATPQVRHRYAYGSRARVHSNYTATALPVHLRSHCRLLISASRKRTQEQPLACHRRSLRPTSHLFEHSTCGTLDTSGSTALVLRLGTANRPGRHRGR
jgi:hypothetical protein